MLKGSSTSESVVPERRQRSSMSATSDAVSVTRFERCYEPELLDLDDLAEAIRNLLKDAELLAK